MLPAAITNAIEALADLPGIGTRSAERLVFTLLKAENHLDQKIAESIGSLKANIHECEQCYHYCDGENCPLCSNKSRNQSSLCIVETPVDLVAIERTHEYKGLYHVLHGVISPLNKVKPDDLRIPQLFERIKKNPEISEVILATSGNIEGDATALYISENLEKWFGGKVTRLARGIPSGGDLDYLDAGTLSRAISERREI